MCEFLLGLFEHVEYLQGEEQVIHCDCKTLNFLVARDEQGEEVCKLADFGMSVRNDEKDILGGSPMYMAPEHLTAWRRMTDDFDHRSDIYALRVVLFEALVGYLPYQVIEDEDDSRLVKLLDEETGEFLEPVLDLRKLNEKCSSGKPVYVPPPIFPDSVSEKAQNFILRLMEPFPDDRITMAEAKEHPWFATQESD